MDPSASPTASERPLAGLRGAMGNDVDFAALIEMTARASGLELSPENVEVDDGLGEPDGD